MQDRLYLLSIRDFLDGGQGEALMERAKRLVDESRMRKIQSIRQPQAKAASLGAGLLLQLAVQEAAGICSYGLQGEIGLCPQRTGMSNTEHKKVSEVYTNIIRLCPGELLTKIGVSLPLQFFYGPSGKPYLKDYPYHFNLSHSGEYVVCVISDAEVGVDIQEHRGGSVERLAKRYFSENENRLLGNCASPEQVRMFYDLWAKKEAYGKLTGEGITKSLEVDLSQPEEDYGQDIGVCFQKIEMLPNYSLVVCKHYNVECLCQG